MDENILYRINPKAERSFRKSSSPSPTTRSYSALLYPFRLLFFKLVSEDLQRGCDEHPGSACSSGELLAILHSATDYTG